MRAHSSIQALLALKQWLCIFSRYAHARPAVSGAPADSAACVDAHRRSAYIGPLPSGAARDTHVCVAATPGGMHARTLLIFSSGVCFVDLLYSVKRDVEIANEKLF